MASPALTPTLTPRLTPTLTPRNRTHASFGARTSYASRAATRAPNVHVKNVHPRNVHSRNVHPNTQRSGGSAPIRLTARGRFAAFVASLLALGAVVVAAGQIADASATEQSAQHSVVVVQAGDTLWGIAKDVAPGVDPRAVVHQIRQLNDLGTRSLQAGQSIVVPSLG
jgi:LysM repeat protein